MITAWEAERIGLVNKLVSLTPEEELSVLSDKVATTARATTTTASKEEQQQEKQIADSKLAKILNKKLMDECLCLFKRDYKE